MINESRFIIRKPVDHLWRPPELVTRGPPQTIGFFFVALWISVQNFKSIPQTSLELSSGNRLTTPVTTGTGHQRTTPNNRLPPYVIMDKCTKFQVNTTNGSGVIIRNVKKKKKKKKWKKKQKKNNDKSIRHFGRNALINQPINQSKLTHLRHCHPPHDSIRVAQNDCWYLFCKR